MDKSEQQSTGTETVVAPDIKTTTIRWEEDWVERLRRLCPDDSYLAQSIRDLLLPYLSGQIDFRRDDSGAVTQITGRDRQGRKVTLDLRRRPIRKLPALSPPPKMGRPRLD